MFPDFSGFDKRLQELIDIQKKSLEVNHAILVALRGIHEDLGALHKDLEALREEVAALRAERGLP